MWRVFSLYQTSVVSTTFANSSFIAFNCLSGLFLNKVNLHSLLNMTRRSRSYTHPENPVRYHSSINQYKHGHGCGVSEDDTQRKASWSSLSSGSSAESSSGSRKGASMLSPAERRRALSMGGWEQTAS